MSSDIPINLALGRFKRLPQRSSEVWQGGLVKFPMWVDSPDGPEEPPFRPHGAIWCSVRTGLMHVALAPEGQPGTPDLALQTLIEFGLKWAKQLEGRPARLEVRDPALRDALEEALRGLDTPVMLVDDLPHTREALRELEKVNGIQEPGLLDVPGMTIERVRAFAEAAALFYAARPWERLTADDLVVVEHPDLPPDLRHVTVLGRGGEITGLAFLETRDEFDALAGLGPGPPLPVRLHGVTFRRGDELPFADVDAWEEHALPLAAPEAYPLAADQVMHEPLVRPDAAELAWMEAVLRALAAANDDELDSGQWRARVETIDGPVDLTFTLPLLIEAEAGVSRITAPAPAALRAVERASVRIARTIEGREFASEDDLNEQLDLWAGQTPAPDRELSPLERAQDLAYDAMDAIGRRRVKLAREALAISDRCADAWIVLADEAVTVASAIELYNRAVSAGREVIGDRFEDWRGEMWDHLEARPYMRARLGLAQVLGMAGRRDEEADHYRGLLDLNPNDNQAVRYLLLAHVLTHGRFDEAGGLLAEYEEDPQAAWLYGRALWTFAMEGDTVAARATLKAAIAGNPHVPKYLLEPEASPEPPAAFALGTHDEAAYVADLLGDAFDTTRGALEWLEAHGRRPRPRARRGRRGR